MNNEIAKFDLTEHIRNKVREVLVNSIPDDQMNKMIQNEFNAFFKPDQYGHDSPFKRIVWAMLEEQTKGIAREWLDKNAETQWDDTGRQKLVGAMVAEIAPLVQERLIANITQQALSDLRNLLNR